MNYGKKKAAKRQKKITSKSTMQGKRIVVRLFNRKDLLLSFMLMTEALRLNVLYLLVPIEYTSLLMRYRKIFNMLLLQSRMSVFISITV